MISLHLFLAFILSDLSESITPKCEVKALEDFFDATSGQNWDWKYPLSEFGNKWNFSDPNVDPCASSWQGLTCRKDQNISVVKYIDLQSYNLTGFVPSSISNLTQLVGFKVKDNFVSGVIPRSFCQCKNLTLFDMSFNILTGNVPSCLVNNLTMLKYFDLETNLLTGTIPAVNHTRPKMEYFSVSINFIHGTIPSSLVYFPNIQYLYLFGCLLTGTIPESFVNLTYLKVLALNTNYLTGPIPSGIFNISSMNYLYMHQNIFTGSLPELNNLHNLYYLTLYENMMTGPIPPSIEAVQQLRVLSLDDNLFTGHLPSGLGKLQYLQQLDLYSCYFSGSIPQSLSQLPLLQILLLGENLFTGNPSPAFNYTQQVSLEQVDLSNNAFVGQLPPGIFGPTLRTLSSVQTCFNEPIPQEICNAKSLEALVIDAVGSGTQCPSFIWPFAPGSPAIVHVIPGGIPSCLWTGMKNLSVLHMASNGLTGSIPSLPSYLNLSSLDLSFNSMNKGIPRTLQSWQRLTYLNLQNNRFTGEINDIGALNYAYNPSDNGVTLYLWVNRLSGVIPLQLQYAYDVNICNGNMFSCSFAHQPPLHDPSSSEYVCGSNLLSVSLYIFGCTLAIWAIICILWMTASTCHLLRVGKSWRGLWMQLQRNYDVIFSEYALQEMIYQLQTEKSRFSKYKVLILQIILWKYKIDDLLTISYPQDSADKAMISSLSFRNQELKRIRNVINFLRTARVLRNIAIALLAVIFLFAIPSFPVLKLYYGSYVHQYLWAYSGVFFTGYQPALFLIVMWMLLLGIVATATKMYVPHKLPVEKVEKKTMETIHEEPDEDNDEFDEDNNNAGDTKEGTEETKLGKVEMGVNSEVEKKNSLEEKELSERTSRFDSISISSSVQVPVSPSDSKNKPSSIMQRFEYLTRLLWDGASRVVRYLRRFTVWISIAAMMCNIVVVLTLKVLFIYLLLGTDVTFTEKIMLDVALSLVDLFWSIILVPAYINRLPKKTALGKLNLKVSLLYFNIMVAPILVIGVSDPSCFSGLFVKNAKQVTSIVFPTCLIYQANGTQPLLTDDCIFSSSWTSDQSYVPAFFYNYTCYSTILKDYIPIFVFSATFSILMIPVLFIYTVTRKKRTWVFNLLPHIFWVEPLLLPVYETTTAVTERNVSRVISASNSLHVTLDSDNPLVRVSSTEKGTDASSNLSNVTVSDLPQNRQMGDVRDTSPLINRALTDPTNLFHPYIVIASILNDFVLLMTFGLMCPFLAAAIVVNLCLTHFMWEILLSRYLCSISSSFAFTQKPSIASKSSSNMKDDVRQLNSSVGMNESPISFSANASEYEAYQRSSKNSDTKSLPDSVLWRQRYISVCENDSITYVDRLCRNVWHGPKKCLWLMVYGSALFFALVTMDMVGDQQGWEIALWAPASVIFLAFLTLSAGNFVAMSGKMKAARVRLISSRRSRKNSSSMDNMSERTISSVELAVTSIIVDDSQRSRSVYSVDKTPLKEAFVKEKLTSFH